MNKSFGYRKQIESEVKKRTKHLSVIFFWSSCKMTKYTFFFIDNMLEKQRKNMVMMTTCIKEALMQTIYLIK